MKRRTEPLPESYDKLRNARAERLTRLRGWLVRQVLPRLFEQHGYKREADRLRDGDESAVLAVAGQLDPAGYAASYAAGGDFAQAVTWAARGLDDMSLFDQALAVSS